MHPSDVGGRGRDAAERALLERLALPRELAHLGEALTHPSFANEQKDLALPNNQRLEFLGDAVLSLCVSEELMAAFDSVDEGQLTVMRAALVNAPSLAARAREIGLDRALSLGRGADQCGERQRVNVLADALEALLGCIFLDCGLDAARRVARTLLFEQIEHLVAEGGIERDAKSRLQELVQRRGLPPPVYLVVEERGPPHAREYSVEVSAQVEVRLASDLWREEPTQDDEAPRYAIVALGSGSSKKHAEQAAARRALEALDAGEVLSRLDTNNKCDDAD